jgi:hypothetical protein
MSTITIVVRAPLLVQGRALMRRRVPLEGPELVAFFVLLLALWQFVDGQPARREDYQMSGQRDRAIGATGQVGDVTFSRVYSVAPGTITKVQLVRRRDGSLAERIDIQREDGRRCTLGWSKRVLVLRQPTEAEDCLRRQLEGLKR